METFKRRRLNGILELLIERKRKGRGGGGGKGRTRQYSRLYLLVLRLEISTIVNHSTIGGSWSNATGICVKYNSLITENS